MISLSIKITLHYTDSGTGDPTIIKSLRNSCQGTGYILSKMSATNNNKNIKTE